MPRRPQRPKFAAPRGAKPGKGAPLPFRPHESFEAIYLGHPEGAGGFLRLPGMGKGSDLLVDWREAHGAIHGDRVQAEITGFTGLTGLTGDGRARAAILKVLSRTDAPVPAKLQKQAWGWRAVPVEPRLGQVITVPPTDLAGDGELVSVQLDPDVNATPLRGKVIARLGKSTDLKIENKLTAALYQLSVEFPAAVMRELAPFPTEIPAAWVQGREDLRKLTIVTIDPPTAKDFDDAISLERLPENGGWILGVHIADVSHYVAEGGPLDQEARSRGTSVYFPDECIPMIPDRLSGDLCSLRPNVDRLTMSAWVTLSPELEMVETRFSESVIHSKRRLTYDEAKEAAIDLSPTQREELGSEICALLDESLVISRRLTENRLERGAMNLDTAEAEFLFDEEGRPMDARRYNRHDAHRLIEEFMLLANEAVARHFTRLKVPTLYRIHDEPNAEKLMAFAEVAKDFGLLKSTEEPTPEVLNALLDKIRGGPLEVMLNTLLLRSLKQAEYSPENIGHSGLALEDYLHFTSPIRRYPDLVVHRLLRRILRKEPLHEGLFRQLVDLGRQCSDAERKAMEAERENTKWKGCLLMKEKVGQKFEGRVQGFSPKVMFVVLDAPFVEAGIPLASLGGSFQLDEHKTHAVGMRGNVKLSIGDKVMLEITAVDEDLRRISAWILEAKASDSKGKPFVFSPTLAAPARLQAGDIEAPKKGRGEATRGRKSKFHQPEMIVSPRPKKERKPKGSVRGGGKRRP